MQYMLIFAETDEALAHRHHPQQAEGYWAAWMSYIAAMRECGALVSGNGLMPPHAATTLRVRDGRREVQDGPYAGAREQLGGYVILDCADLDAALDWAARAPCADSGAVEVRPVLPPPSDQPA